MVRRILSKDKTVREVYKENKSYLTWLLDQKDFKWFGTKGEKLKESIQKELGVFIQPTINNFKLSKVESLEKHQLPLSEMKNLW